jgi:RimJ/RimL family protein N-acetyltransferase
MPLEIREIAAEHAESFRRAVDIGWCDVIPKTRPTHAHCGVLGMGLLPAFRGRGLGTALIKATLQGASGCGITRVELTVHADNIHAIKLYEKVGFETEGRLRDAVLIDGQYKDLILMAKIDCARGRS